MGREHELCNLLEIRVFFWILPIPNTALQYQVAVWKMNYHNNSCSTSIFFIISSANTTKDLSIDLLSDILINVE